MTYWSLQLQPRTFISSALENKLHSGTYLVTQIFFWIYNLNISFYTNRPRPRVQEWIPLGVTGKKNESDECLLVTNSLSHKHKIMSLRKFTVCYLTGIYTTLMDQHAKGFIITPQSLLVSVAVLTCHPSSCSTHFSRLSLAWQSWANFHMQWTAV